MAHPSSALTTFFKTSNRSLALMMAAMRIQVKDEVRKDLQISSTEITDMIRSSVVLSVSAMDAYFTDRFVEDFVSYIKARGPSRRMIAFLSDAGLDTAQALEMAAMKRPHRRVRTLVQRHLERYVTQKVKKIDELFSAYCINDFCSCVQGRVGRKTLLRSVELLVERRHQIVHNGDLNSHGRLQQVAPQEFLRRIKDVGTFVMAADEFLGEVL